MPAAETDDELVAGTQSPPASTRRSGRQSARQSMQREPNVRSSARKRKRDDHVVEVGDKTVTENEDFSMISMETLQSAKESSFLRDSRSKALPTIAEQPAHPEISVASVSYLPSSPPRRSIAQPVEYPEITEEAAEAGEALRRSAKYDAMSWRPTGTAKVLGGVAALRNSLSNSRDHAPEWDHQAGNWQPADANAFRDAPMRRDSGQPAPVFTADGALDISSDEDDIGDDLEYDHDDMQEVHDYDGRQDEQEAHDEEQFHDDEAVQDEEEVIDVNADESGEYQEEEDEDIWQEASRSVHSIKDHSMASRNHVVSAVDEEERERRKRSPQNLDDFFADEPLQPRRAKIPRTWRRSSGIELSYVDSPGYGLVAAQGTHVDKGQEAPQEEAEERKGSTDGSRILTPPSTDDERHAQAMAAAAAEMDPSSEILQPDAEATRFHSDVIGHNVEVEVDDEVDYEDEEVDGSEAGSEGDNADHDPADDTGVFFTHPLQQVPARMNTPLLAEQPRRPPRPARRETVNLTELLNLDAGTSPAKAQPPSARAKQSPKKPAENSLLQRMEQRRRYGRPVEISTNPLAGVLALDDRSSPAKKRILHRDEATENTRPASSGRSVNTAQRQQNQEVLKQAKQICEQNRTYGRHYRSKVPAGSAIIDRTETTASQTADSSRLLPSHDVSAISTSFRSYEERLNVESPQKVRVNFNESSSMLPLSPGKHARPPLFDQPAATKPTTATPAPVSQAQTERKEAQAPEGGLLKRLWTAVVGPNESQEGFPAKPWSATHPPAPIAQPPKTNKSPVEPAPRQRPAQVPPPDNDSSLLEGTCPPALRAALRARYGVLSNTHPWRLYHMRTLHRLHNSRCSGRPDTLVPRDSARLPAVIAEVVGQTPRSITGRPFVFTAAHAHVVQAFLALLVPAHVVDGMRSGEVMPLGDRLTKELRGDRARGDEVLRRDGLKDPVWRVRPGDKAGPGAWVESLTGEIEVEFVIRALGDVVAEEQRAAKKRRLARSEQQ